MKRVAVTGVGVISPVGNTAEVFFHNLAAGRSGIRRISSDFADRLSVTVAAESTFRGEDYYSKKQLGLLDRASQMALAAASQAWTDSGLDLSDEEKHRSGVYMGTGMGGANSLDEMFGKLYREDVARVSPLFVTKIMSNAPASHISIQYGLSGPCLTFSTACSSSSVSIGEAFRQIKAGYADIILAGGAESLLAYGSFKCWESLGVLAPEDAENPAASCRPFSRDRAGFVLGEGAAVVVLEDMERARKRGAVIYAELAGYGSTSDAHHITSPSVAGQARAMLRGTGGGGNIDRRDRLYKRTRDRDDQKRHRGNPGDQGSLRRPGKVHPGQFNKIHARTSAGGNRRGGIRGGPPRHETSNNPPHGLSPGT